MRKHPRREFEPCQAIAVTGGTVNNRSLRFMPRKIPFPPSGLEVARLTRTMRKNEYSAKTALHIIINPIAVPFLAKLRRDNFAPFWRQ